MGKNILFVALAPALLLTGGCKAQNQDHDPIIQVENDDKAMNNAKAEAQRTLPTFLAYLEKPSATVTDLGFKFPLGGAEHIWVSDVRRDGDTLVGKLANMPAMAGHSLGEEVKVPLKDVSDWAARVNGKMQGHYTTRVLLDELAPDEAAVIKQNFGW